MVPILGWPGRRRPPGGWKWIAFGAAIRNWRGWWAYRLGGSPWARVKARENASTAS
jgi:hypothetical protein